MEPHYQPGTALGVAQSSRPCSQGPGSRCRKTVNTHIRVRWVRVGTGSGGEDLQGQAFQARGTEGTRALRWKCDGLMGGRAEQPSGARCEVMYFHMSFSCFSGLLPVSNNMLPVDLPILAS